MEFFGTILDWIGDQFVSNTLRTIVAVLAIPGAIYGCIKFLRWCKGYDPPPKEFLERIDERHDAIEVAIQQLLSAAISKPAGAIIDLRPGQPLLAQNSPAPAIHLRENGEDLSIETSRFLTHQRFHHRVNLARIKWDWLLISTYYHPAIRKSLEENQWHPRLIGGYYTVADFAGSELPHERLASQAGTLRDSLAKRMTDISVQLRANIKAIEDELITKHAVDETWVLPWNSSEVLNSWICLVKEIENKPFADGGKFKSYCGFRDLFSVRDTPASGIYPQRNDTPDVFAYAASMELTWWLCHIDANVRDKYQSERQSAANRARPDQYIAGHQRALRRVCVQLLDAIWDHNSALLSRGGVRLAAR